MLNWVFKMPWLRTAPAQHPSARAGPEETLLSVGSSDEASTGEVGEELCADTGGRDTSVLGRPLGTPTWRLPMDLGPEGAPVAVRLSRSKVGCHLARACVEGM